MKAFFKNYSYDMLKMFLNQFGTAIFGISLAFAAKYAQSPVLLNATSVGAILFYLFGFRGSYHRMSGTAILERFEGEEIVERVESPAMWEQMAFKPDRISPKQAKSTAERKENPNE